MLIQDSSKFWWTVGGLVYKTFQANVDSGNTSKNWSTVAVSVAYRGDLYPVEGSFGTVTIFSILCTRTRDLLRFPACQFLTHQSTLCTSQHGFRKNRSYTTKLLELLEWSHCKIWLRQAGWRTLFWQKQGVRLSESSSIFDWVRGKGALYSLNSCAVSTWVGVTTTRVPVNLASPDGVKLTGFMDRVDFSKCPIFGEQVQVILGSKQRPVLSRRKKAWEYHLTKSCMLWRQIAGQRKNRQSSCRILHRWINRPQRPKNTGKQFKF